MKNSKKLLFLVVAIILVASLTMSLVSCKKGPEASNSDYDDPMWSLNGYQQNPGSNVKVVEGKSLVSIQEMLTATGLDINTKNQEEKKQIVENIYNVLVTNAGVVKNKAWLICTDATVKAYEVKSLISPEVLEVGIRSAFSLAQGEQGSFSQTISGVTKLDLLGSLGDQLKSNFGWNVQEFSSDKVYAYKQGKNGGALYYTAETNPDYLKYILGAYNESLYDKVGRKAVTIKDVEPNTEDNATEQPTTKRVNAWDPLEERVNNPEFVYDKDTGATLELGNLQDVAWAVYNFKAEWLSDETTVTYDKDTDVYTLEITVKEENVDEACKFAKANLIKDTCNYILLKNPKYTKLTNKIEVYGNGLIKSWERDEELGSEEQAKLVVLPGTCEKGGLTGNKSLSVFSYNELDTNAERLAALYFPEVGTKIDLTKYPTLAQYQPIVNKR